MSFMSTTKSREIAMAYAGGAKGSGLLFEIQMGLIDRGAELGWLSQYPAESEILFAPLTGLEIVGLRSEGSVVVAEVPVSPSFFPRLCLRPVPPTLVPLWPDLA